MNNNILEETRTKLPFSLAVTVEPKEDLFVGIMIKNKISSKIEKEFSKGSKIKILVNTNINYNGLEVTVCTDDKTIDHYTVPNTILNFDCSLLYGGKCLINNNIETSKTGYILTDLLLNMIINRQYISNINVSIPDVYYLHFNNNDDMMYHYYNLIINLVCNVKKVIELSYALNYNVKSIRVYSNNKCFILKRTDSIVEYTINKENFYLFKTNDNKGLLFINGNQKVTIDVTNKSKHKGSIPNMIKSEVELYKVVKGIAV